MAAALATRASSEPYWRSHLAAVTGPTPGTPGMLSEVSPTKASQSTIKAGGTPNFCSTPATSVTTFFMVSNIRTRSSTNCAKSLSPLTISTGSPFAVACRVNVPITSSASTPATCSSGKPKARTQAYKGSICRISSGSSGGRWALYSTNISWRKVLPGASKITARQSGR